MTKLRFFNRPFLNLLNGGDINGLSVPIDAESA